VCGSVITSVLRNTLKSNLDQKLLQDVGAFLYISGPTLLQVLPSE
jgi:hypothetical protein